MSEPLVAQQAKAYFEQHPDDLVCAYVFGSMARGNARTDSDVDVAILYRSAPSHTLDGLGVGLAGELERHLRRTVDVVVLNHAPADLIHRVLRDGLVVFEADRSARIRFEVRARNIYFDLQPVLRRYRKADKEIVHG